MNALLGSPSQNRYERKFFISGLRNYEVEAIVRLHPAMFSQVYPERYVNNIYFDSPNLRSYWDNVDGVTRRTKVRVRWYGDVFSLVDKPTLEVKSKSGLLGSKTSFPLLPFSLDESFRRDGLQQVLRASCIPEHLKIELACLYVPLLNRYLRRYYQSANGDFRITVDSQMVFYRLDTLHNSYLQRRSDLENTVLELKYSPENDQSAAEIAGCFPFRMTKHSKYASGIEMLSGMN